MKESPEQLTLESHYEEVILPSVDAALAKEWFQGSNLRERSNNCAGAVMPNQCPPPLKKDRVEAVVLKSPSSRGPTQGYSSRAFNASFVTVCTVPEWMYGIPRIGRGLSVLRWCLAARLGVLPGLPTS